MIRSAAFVVVVAALAVLAPPLALSAELEDGWVTGVQPSPCPPNAALSYWRAWNGRTPQVWEVKYLETEFRSFREDWVPSPELAGVLEGAQGDIAAIMKASRMEYCDWGIPLREEGFETPRPHIARMQTTARVLMADARRLSQKGDMAGAGERLAALLLMSRHAGTDKAVTSVLAAQRLAADFAMSEMRRLAPEGKLDEASRATLMEALNKVSGADPFGMRAALREEPFILSASIKRLCRGPDAAKEFLQKFAPRATPEERAQSGVEQLDEGALHAAADRIGVIYEEVLANWDSPEALQTVRAIEAQKKSGDYGAVAVLTGSDLGNMRRVVELIEMHVRETVAAVSGNAAQGAPK